MIAAKECVVGVEGVAGGANTRQGISHLLL